MVSYGLSEPLPAPEPAISFLRGGFRFPCKTTKRHLFHVHGICLRSDLICKPVMAGIYRICMPALQGSFPELKLLIMLRTDPLPCAPADRAVRQIIIRIRGTSAPVHGSLDPSDLRRTVFGIRTEHCQSAGIPGYDSRRGSPDIQTGSSMADWVLHRRLPFQDKLQIVVVFRTYRFPMDTAVLHTGFQSFPVIIRPDLRLDHLPTPMKPAVFKPHAGSIFLPFHTFEFIVLPEMNAFAVIEQILLHRTPYGRGNLLCSQGIDVLLIPVLLHRDIRMQLVFAESITSADSGKLLIDTVLILLGKITFPAGSQKISVLRILH